MSNDKELAPAPSNVIANREFVRRAFFDQADLIGARWWNESFGLAPSAAGAMAVPTRRTFFKFAAWAGAAGIAFVAIRSCFDDDDGLPQNLDALEVQRREGWNAGAADRPLSFAGSIPFDVDGDSRWRAHIPDLLTTVTPPAPLQPYAVPTLFQALSDPAPASQKLREEMVPVNTPAMNTAFGRGQAFAELFTTADAPKDVAVIVDLPGPESVAFAAGAATQVAPVFAFDNWPHPLGVVPSHLTLAACLYYHPLFARTAAARPPKAPPMFVLDANRLNHYQDDADAFDNRYVARLPSPQGFVELGVRRILYVRPSSSELVELDDLNADFVALDRDGVPVRAVDLTEFTPQTITSSLTGGNTTGYFYGGGPTFHPTFWHVYSWHTIEVSRPAASRLGAVAPAPALQAPGYRPTFRPTIFATRTVGGLSGIGRQKPSGFGRVSVRVNGQGRITSFGGRSGSFGRSRSSFSG